MVEITTHAFKARRGHAGCATCGGIRLNEAAHGHSCSGKIITVDGVTACYVCHKRFEVGPPITIRWR